MIGHFKIISPFSEVLAIAHCREARRVANRSPFFPPIFSFSGRSSSISHLLTPWSLCHVTPRLIAAGCGQTSPIFAQSRWFPPFRNTGVGPFASSFVGFKLDSADKAMSTLCLWAELLTFPMAICRWMMVFWLFPLVENVRTTARYSSQGGKEKEKLESLRLGHSYSSVDPGQKRVWPIQKLVAEDQRSIKHKWAQWNFFPCLWVLITRHKKLLPAWCLESFGTIIWWSVGNS